MGEAMKTLPLRQIHLDFHTAPEIPDVGRDFDGDRFASTLKAAGVDAVNLFAKCHHGFVYYKGSKVGTPHPNLARDLFREQVDAVSAAGIVPVAYVTAGWEQLATHRHPEYRRLDGDGAVITVNGPERESGWREICFNTAYTDTLVAQIEEVGRMFPKIEGYWLDILRQTPCHCPRCLDDMADAGLDPHDPADQRVQAVRVRDLYLERATKAAKRMGDVSVFHNTGHLPRGERRIFSYFDHLEIESLPTGGWGYDHFPVSAAYAQTLEKPYLGMTGRFHTMWGEFGGLKHRNALRYEAMQMLAFGAAVSIGDHLHPTGAIDEGVYEAIGAAYRESGEVRSFVQDVEPVADIAIYSAAAQQYPGEAEGAAHGVVEDSGAVRVMLEGHYLFAVVDDETELDDYKVVVFPDTIRFDGALAAKVKAYIAGGGKVVLSGVSGLDAEGNETLELGGTREGPSPFEPDFVALADGYAPSGFDTHLVRYGRSQRVRIGSGESMGDIHDPYLNRSGRVHCGHLHFPARPEPSGYAVGVVTDSTALFAHNVFTSYVETGTVNLRHQIERVLDRLLGREKRLRTNLPSYGRATVRAQDGRDVLHFLSVPLALRGKFWDQPIQVVEDMPEVSGIGFSFLPRGEVKAVTLQPGGRALPHSEVDGRVEAELPSFEGRQIVVVDYA